MGPLKVAHLNGLSVSRQPMHEEIKDEPERASNDERVGHHRAFSLLTRDLIHEGRVCEAKTNVVFTLREICYMLLVCC